MHVLQSLSESESLKCETMNFGQCLFNVTEFNFVEAEA